MKIIDIIMRLFGYENINNIKIQEDFIKHPPRESKMSARRMYCWVTDEFFVPIIIDENNILQDGYTSYLIAAERKIKYVKVIRRENIR